MAFAHFTLRAIPALWIILGGIFKWLDVGCNPNSHILIIHNKPAIVAICWSEVFVGLSLIFLFRHFLVRLCVNAMLSLFLLTHIFLYSYGVADCGCFGEYSPPSWLMITLNILMLIDMYFIGKFSRGNNNSHHILPKLSLLFLISFAPALLGANALLNQRLCSLLHNSTIEIQKALIQLPLSDDVQHNVVIFKSNCPNCAIQAKSIVFQSQAIPGISDTIDFFEIKSMDDNRPSIIADIFEDNNMNIKSITINNAAFPTPVFLSAYKGKIVHWSATFSEFIQHVHD